MYRNIVPTPPHTSNFLKLAMVTPRTIERNDTQKQTHITIFNVKSLPNLHPCIHPSTHSSVSQIPPTPSVIPIPLNDSKKNRQQPPRYQTLLHACYSRLSYTPPPSLSPSYHLLLPPPPRAASETDLTAPVKPSAFDTRRNKKASPRCAATIIHHNRFRQKGRRLTTRQKTAEPATRPLR